MNTLEMYDFKLLYPAEWKKKVGRKISYDQGFIRLESPQDRNYCLAVGWQRKKAVIQEHGGLSGYVDWFIKDLKRRAVHFEIISHNQLKVACREEIQIKTRLAVNLGGFLLRSYLEQYHITRFVLCGESERLFTFYGVVLGPHNTEDKEKMIYDCLNSLECHGDYKLELVESIR